ncbi:HAD family hydrolase [Bifidobacterium sp. UBA744]|uniref:HAD family hydrolase n=1 Tax=Bifidobacterium sp. UBA744 TaxID=1946112 RepID=UPI0025B877E9|nr:HAD family hydrolase [Bifidobacterium sp. UBA744]
MTESQPYRLLVADLDGTLLHDGATFEERFLSQRAIDVMIRAHDAGVRFAVSTARPVSTGLPIVGKLPVDACVYLNGALIDFDPATSTYETLTAPGALDDGKTIRMGFSSRRACQVCRMLLDHLPALKCGVVMDDVRYTNFDVGVYWKTQTWRYSDFTDVPDGTADKIIVFPDADQWDALGALIPDDLSVSVSEGVMWMLMNPLANKEHALSLLCEHLRIPLANTVAFGDDLIDIAMLRRAGRGVAVANANPKVLNIADEICPSNNEDGVAEWIVSHIPDMVRSSSN